MPSHPDRSEALSFGDARLVVDLDHGARATEWTVGDLSLLAHHGPDPVDHGMYAMAPWAGRLRGNEVEWGGEHHALPVTYEPWALHGTALRQAATVASAGADGESAWLVARIDEHPGWPWPMTVDLGWELRADRLTTTITVRALDESFPVVVGWHPWFRRRLARGEPLQWSLDATGRLERGADHLPTGRVVTEGVLDGTFDDAFLVPDGRAAARWPGALELEVASDAGWYVVYDQLPDCVCLEPQSGPPDGLRAGYGREVTVASPGAPHTLTTTWTFRPIR